MKNIKLWIFIGIIVVILVLNHIFGWSEWLRNTDNLAFLSDMVNDHLLEAVDSAKDLFFGDRQKWDAMVKRDMMKDVSWEQSAKQYLEFYKELMA